MTDINVIDRPCGFGKSTELIAEIKKHRIANPSAKILLVVPELGEVERFINAIGSDWVTAPVADESENKTDAFIGLLRSGNNVVTTHALYKRIRLFQHLLSGYHVIIDEVPTVAEDVSSNLGSGVFKQLLHNQKYITIDPVTKLISATGNWDVFKEDFSTGIGKQIQKFMRFVCEADVYYVNDTFQVLPLPDVFFTKPRSLTILTFLFKGTQLYYYMIKCGYKHTHQHCNNELIQFKYQLNKNLLTCKKFAKGKFGYTAMSSSNPNNREIAGNYIKNLFQSLRKIGMDIPPESILVASHKDAWFGKEENKNSAVSNKSSLKKLTRLKNATYTAMVTRGTNKFRHLDVLLLLGKLNINPKLAEFLGMGTKESQRHHALSELIQLIYRTAIRDGKKVFLISADEENIKILHEFITLK